MSSGCASLAIPSKSWQKSKHRAQLITHFVGCFWSLASENSAIINMVVLSDGLLLLPLAIDPVLRLLDQMLMSMVDNLSEGPSSCINLLLPTVFFSHFVKRCLEFGSV